MSAWPSREPYCMHRARLAKHRLPSLFADTGRLASMLHTTQSTKAGPILRQPCWVVTLAL